MIFAYFFMGAGWLLFAPLAGISLLGLWAFTSLDEKAMVGWTATVVLTALIGGMALAATAVVMGWTG